MSQYDSPFAYDKAPILLYSSHVTPKVAHINGYDFDPKVISTLRAFPDWRSPEAFRRIPQAYPSHIRANVKEIKCPSWIVDMIPRLGLNYDNPVDMCLVITDEFQALLREQPFKEWPQDFPERQSSSPSSKVIREKDHYWIQRSEDNHAAVIHYHSRLDSFMTSLPFPEDKKAKPGLTTTYRATRVSEGYGGRPFPIKVAASGQSLIHNVDDKGFELVVLRGPWHGISPAPYVDIIYRIQSEHVKDMMWYFGLSISEEAYMAALRKYCPDWSYQTFYPMKQLPKGTPFQCHPPTTLNPGFLSEDLLFLDPNDKKVELCHKNLLCPKHAWPRDPHPNGPNFMGQHSLEILTELGVMDRTYDLALMQRNKRIQEHWKKQQEELQVKRALERQALIDQGIDPDAEDEDEDKDEDEDREDYL